MKKRTSFIKLIKLWGIIFLIGIGISIIAIDVIGTCRDFNFRADQMRANYIDSQKQIIKQEVHRVVDLISYEKAQSEMLTREKIKSRVYEAYSIAQNIYQQNNTAKSEAEIQRMILDVLRSIRFENETGYYFAIRTDGIVMLNANKSELEGKSLLNLQDTHGKNFIEEMIKIAKQSGEGFDEYYWVKPGVEGNNFKKISFIKIFKPYSWIIGTGLYVDDVEEQIKKDLLSTISRIRFGKEGYIFINRLNGDALVSNGKLFSGTKKLWEVFNKNPEKMKDIFDKEYNAAIKPEGDYIYYSHITLTNPNKESPKASFIYGIPDLQWLVGAGVYLDDVETDIALIQTALKDQIEAKIFYFVLIAMAIVGLFFLLFNWLNRELKNDFEYFVSFFNRAAHSDVKIEREVIKFVELDKMAEYTNKMLTDRKQAEDALRESEKRYRAFFVQGPDGVVVLDPETAKMIEFNDQACQQLGYSREEFVLLRISEIEAKETAKETQEHIQKVLREGYDDFETLQCTKQGEIRHVHVTAQIIEISGRSVYHCIWRDITERKRAEAALRENEELLRATIESTADGILVVDEKGIVTHTNRRFAKMWQIPEELIRTREDKKLLDFVLGQLKEPEAFLSKVQALYKTSDEDFDVLDFKDGRVFERFSCPLIRDNQIVGRVWSFRDITERKMAEKEKTELQSQLQQAQKMESIGTLAGGIAHDFNNILGIIIGNTELALDDTPEWERARFNLEEIRTAALRAKDVVIQLLSFARKTKLEQKPIKLIPVVKDSIKLLRATIPVNIDIHQNITASSDTIFANPTQIHQVIINLCTNASYAMQETGGILGIKIENVFFKEQSNVAHPDLLPGFYVKLTVSDTGQGISPELKDRIFDPYFTTKEVGKGTGMGLSVVHGIVNNYGGKISVESELGKGTAFYIYFPVVEEEPVIETETIEELHTGNERILFVDDDKSLIYVCRYRLERLGYQVETKTNPIEALELFRTNPDQFDLVITDMAMPQMTGDQMIGEILKIRPNMPIILCTGFSEKIDEKKAKKIGVAEYVEKPFDKHDFAFKIRKVLDGK